DDLLEGASANPNIHSIDANDLVAGTHSRRQRRRIWLPVLHELPVIREHADVSGFFPAFAFRCDGELKAPSITFDDNRKVTAWTRDDGILNILPVRLLFSVKR